ncbi:MAG: hypothetical protein HRU75_00020 [Planctomycetia bacterium]|nr:MAG: hypothetical protein HRU75_00020 [Planctomycetia bacterium]
MLSRICQAKHSVVARGAMLALCAVVISQAVGQVITHGDSSFDMPAANTTGATVRTGSAGGTSNMFAGGDTTDQLFQQWWWYRVNGVNNREFALSNRTSNIAVGNELTLHYSEPEGLDAVVRYRLIDGPNTPASCQVIGTVLLTTTSQTPLNVSFFGYIDLDLEGAGGDVATFVAPGQLRVTDQATGFFGEVFAPTANFYGVGAFSTIRALFSDADIDNLANTGVPFGPGDFTGAVQWNVAVASGSPVQLPFAFSLNTSANPCNNQLLGDANCDGNITNFDIDCFITAIVSGEAAWMSACNAGGTCLYQCVLDINRDGRVDNFDIDPFVTCIINFGCP